MVLLTVDAKVRGRERSPGSALPAKLFRFEETDRTFKAISYAIDASSAERVASDHASKATEKDRVGNERVESVGVFDGTESRRESFERSSRDNVGVSREGSAR